MSETHDGKAMPARLGSRVTTGIDLLRGLFALLVVVAHATAIVQELHGAEAAASFGDRLISATLRQGLVWVIGFFVLSGFCIQNSTESGVAATGRLDLPRYFRARVSRIFPFYLIGLAVALVAELLHSPARVSLAKTTAALTMTQGVFGCFTSFENSWSLTNEMFYYLVYGLLLWSTHGRMKKLFGLGAALALMLTAAALAAWTGLGKPSPGIFAIWTIPLQMLIWLGGAALYHHWAPLSRWFSRARGRWAMLGLAFGVVYFFYVRLWLGGVRLMEMELINLAWMPFFFLLLLSLSHMPFLDHPRVRAMAAKLGLLSYPLYLLHSPLQHIMSSLVQPASWFAHAPAVLQWSAYLAAPVVFCVLLGVPAESRLLAWRKRWLNKTPLQHR